MAGRDQSALLLLAAVLVLFASSTATAQQQQQNCSSAKFSAGRSFQRCTSLPVLGASLYWTYHAANGTADVAFRAPSDPSGWVAWGINTQSAGSMAGSSVFIVSHSQDGNGAVSVLSTYLESTVNPSLTNNTLRVAVPAGPAAEYSGGAYTIYATVALPGNRTLQNTVWQAGPLSGGGIATHPTAPPNLQSTQKLDFLSGSRITGAGAPKSRGLLSRRNLRGFQG
ncbi:unnamed protein product [Miscanthus lutarioriparius]|uniref:DOMON domain-containing protein n=1 Tax=Miscanthus lutarioriparius TaxID=422564 RepID=A0A811MT28_9POAL|nr:unnamed protein product [Miscanthus lutarioriparius]